MSGASVGFAATAAFVLASTAPLQDLPGRAWVEPVTGMRFVLLPAGSFTMGSPPGELEHRVSSRARAEPGAIRE
jgi:hypothetical protein